MLSPSLDDDDDSHLCIKCNATIVGLENYVKHRKNRCDKNSKIEASKPEIPSIEALDPTYSLGADVFFQSLELQSSVKKTSPTRLTPPIPTTKSSSERKSNLPLLSSSRDLPRMSPLETNLRGGDWIGGHSLKIGPSEDNQTKLINAVASISGNAKKDIPSTSFTVQTYYYKGDEESEESDESEDEEDDEPPETGGKWKPPVNYTGGKWRPASPEHDWDVLMERYDDYDAPPPSHTKGKWIPGSHDKTQIMQPIIQSKGSVQYWCGPCNRRLGTRAIYEKHLMSNLHMKKVLPENELEFVGNLEPSKKTPEKRIISHPSQPDDPNSPRKKRQRMLIPKVNINLRKKKRKRRLNFIICSGCKSRVRVHLMGKHLMSHYHFRKAAGTQSEVYQQLILDNIDAIVHQSPFQCSPCKFYTNWLSTFMQHWYSEEHQRRIDEIEGRLWCSFCKFECDTSEEMLQHMTGSDHSEVIAVINRSMPIIIRKKNILKCSTCFEEFRYNIEMKRHFERKGHEPCGTATDIYQETHKCHYCKMNFKRSVHLAAHLKSKHKQKAYFCLVCDIRFQSSADAKKHRISTEHRVKRKEKTAQLEGGEKQLCRKCPYCTEKVVLENVVKLKEHILIHHPNIKKKCPKCGMEFVFSQEVSRHIKDNACRFQEASTSTFWNCSQCLFSTDSQAECFYHEVLHSTPLVEVIKTADKERTIEKYACPLCPKSFRKYSLRHHLKQHTFERPFVCSLCGSNFTRQSSLANHIRTIHETSGPIVKADKVAKITEPKPEKVLSEEFTCKRCSKKFVNRTALSRHTPECTHLEKMHCSHDGCEFVATSTKQLVRHLRIHGEKHKPHSCQLCPFKTNQASHMKRHMVCHKGIKPYACPHCTFTCASLENLRKHVVQRDIHSGLYLYNCNLCYYRTNQAKELRTHLISIHGEKYDAKSAVQAVKYYLIRKDFKNFDENLDVFNCKTVDSL